MLHIKRSKVEHIFDAFFRHVIEKGFRSLTMGVDKGNALAIANILNSHVFEQGRLPHPRLSNDVDVARPVLVFDTKTRPPIAKIGLGKVGYLFPV